MKAELPLPDVSVGQLLTLIGELYVQLFQYKQLVKQLSKEIERLKNG